MSSTHETTAEAYDDLLSQYERISNVDHASGYLMWDQHVMMPKGGAPARAEQQSALSAVHHDLLTSDDLAEALDAVDESDLDESQQAVVREIRRQHERAANVPIDLVEDLTKAQAEAHEAWQEAKANDDFDAFAPHLQRLLDLHRERAGHIDPDRDPFEVMFEDREPHLPLSKVEEVFSDLRETLIPLIDDVRENGDDLPTPFTSTYPDEAQKELSEAALDAFGYPEERGRLDTSAHPFTFGTQFDARVTTRYHDDDPLDALMATIHEFGHASYQLGLPDDEYATPLGESVSSGIHESQSRYWENHVGRTRAFWDFFLPEVNSNLPDADDVTAESAYAAANRIKPDNLIRVEADEATYHLHIILRFEIGRQLVAGEIDVEDVPEVWGDTFEEYLGIRPDSDAEGCLQDIHWSSWFASFQNYTIGSVFAAQLDATIREEFDDVDGMIRDGEFAPLWDWLTENVHSHGKRYPTGELIEEATGEPLTATYFTEYVTEKFEALYGL
ncbi:carboxypeptidase M32 [Haloprofundus halobius]|uniref:carboxypeptidase M32 n=1 Tax=Haloprofundus halobius TaxID=2876194 RepID=UPI001CCAEAF0|nr:carboxypeptidase M32 [Haloprofundus halobius]